MLSARTTRGLATIADGAVSVKSAQAIRGARLTRQRFGPADFGRWEPPFVGVNPRETRNRAREAARWDMRGVPTEPAPGKTVYDLVQTIASSAPHKEVFHATHTREKLKWDGRTFAYEAMGYGNGFVDNGLVKGESVLTWLGNEAELVVGFFAAAMSGARVHALPADASPATVREALLGANGARALLFHQRWGSEDRIAQILAEIVPELPDPRNAMAPGASLHSKVFPRLRHIVNTGFGTDVLGQIKGFYQLTAPDEGASELGALPASVDLARAHVGGDTPLWTTESGSILSQEACLGAAASFAKRLSLGPSDRVLVTAPLSSTAGMIGGVLGSLQAGSLVSVVQREFSAEATLDAAAKVRPTAIIATAEQVDALAGAAGGNPFPFLRTGALVGSGKPASAPEWAKPFASVDGSKGTL